MIFASGWRALVTASISASASSGTRSHMLRKWELTALDLVLQRFFRDTDVLRIDRVVGYGVSGVEMVQKLYASTAVIIVSSSLPLVGLKLAFVSVSLPEPLLESLYAFVEEQGVVGYEATRLGGDHALRLTPGPPYLRICQHSMGRSQS